MKDSPFKETQIMQLRCGKCDGLFEELTPIRVSVDIFVAALSAIRCPHCGSKKILMGQNRSGAEDSQFAWGDTLEARAAAWKENGERGLSSIAILEHMSGQTPKDPSAPRDVADLRRCMLLLRRIPEWSARMGEMAIYEQWAKIAPVWEALAMVFADEMGPEIENKASPNTALMLNKILNP